MGSEPTILAFDTSAAHCAAALLVGERIVAERYVPMARGQAERLMGLNEELLAAAGLAWQDLDAIAVGVGPGNFTGVRIAVAAARGLALGLGVPAIGVSGLEAQVHGAPRPVTARLAARRGAFYEQGFTEAGATAPRLVAGDEADEATGAPLTAPVIGPEADPEALTRAIARIAAQRLAEGNTAGRPTPLYVRAPDAAPPRDLPPRLLDA